MGQRLRYNRCRMTVLCLKRKTYLPSDATLLGGSGWIRVVVGVRRGIGRRAALQARHLGLIDGGPAAIPYRRHLPVRPALVHRSGRWKGAVYDHYREPIKSKD